MIHHVSSEQGGVLRYIRFKVLGTYWVLKGDLLIQSRLGKLNLRFGVPPHKLYLWRKDRGGQRRASKASVAEKRAAERSKVKTKTWCRATEGEAVRHSYWSIIQAVCAALSSHP